MNSFDSEFGYREFEYDTRHAKVVGQKILSYADFNSLSTQKYISGYLTHNMRTISFWQYVHAWNMVADTFRLVGRYLLQMIIVRRVLATTLKIFIFQSLSLWVMYCIYLYTIRWLATVIDFEDDNIILCHLRVCLQ